MPRSASFLVTAMIGVALALATPALAKPRQVRAVPQNQYNQLVAPGNDATCVYRNGNLIGCDPDPNIRQRLQNFTYGGGPA